MKRINSVMVITQTLRDTASSKFHRNFAQVHSFSPWSIQFWIMVVKSPYFRATFTPIRSFHAPIRCMPSSSQNSPLCSRSMCLQFTASLHQDRFSILLSCCFFNWGWKPRHRKQLMFCNLRDRSRIAESVASTNLEANVVFEAKHTAWISSEYAPDFELPQTCADHGTFRMVREALSKAHNWLAATRTDTPSSINGHLRHRVVDFTYRLHSSKMCQIHLKFSSPILDPLGLRSRMHGFMYR